MYQRGNNKYGARKAVFLGETYDSTAEANYAQQLDLRQKAKDIAGWERQYVVEIIGYLPDGKPGYKLKHRVDFRIQYNDGRYELVEVKGVETRDYKMTRKLLESLWLPLHPDHTYTVYKQPQLFNKNGWR